MHTSTEFDDCKDDVLVEFCCYYWIDLWECDV
jgi:hypothetical protein